MTQIIRAVFWVIGLLVLIPADAGAQWTVSSPNGSTHIAISLNTSTGALSYSVTQGGAVVIENSALGLSTSAGDFSSGLSFVSRSNTVINESYSLPGRKKASYLNSANEAVLRFSKGGQELHLAVRAYDDGIAYRYRVPGSGALLIYSEGSSFNLPDTATGYAQTYVSNYEGFYPARGNFSSGSFGMPVLASVGSRWLLLAESDIGGSYHTAQLTGGSGNHLRLAWPTATSVSTSRQFNSPWRLAIIGSLANIVESSLVENLSTPSQLADTSWIRPGRSGWSWRAGGNQADDNTHAAFVDSASAMGWEYYLVDDGWQASWVPSLVSYATSKNVGIWLWVNDEDVKSETQMRTLFSRWAGWGVRGVKVDFFDGDTQVTMQLYEKLAQVAAENRLLVNFHGCTKPNGLGRKWPNVLTQEAVFGAEQGELSAAHHLSLLFTRGAIGPMDYTPGAYSNSGGQTTWAHQTALPVLFASYIQHYSDHGAMYRNSIAREFLRALPPAWDDTRLLEGNPSQYATLARRRGNDWYVGTIASGTARTAVIPLSFLTAGTNYTAHVYMDGTSDNDIAYQVQQVASTSVLNIPVRANGGAAIRITAQNVPVVPSAIYKIINRQSGKALAVQNASRSDTAEVIQWAYVDSTTNDEWRLVDSGGGYYDLVNRNSGRTLDVSGASTAAGAHLIQYTSRGSANQQWQFVEAGGGYVGIVSRSSGMAVDVEGASMADGANVIQWPWSGGANQQWQLVQVGSVP
ncbi:glycoside hydrolase family 97 catalytic domain-containing protein [Stigmatella aurantiaca]|uniref:Alpha-glucosidase n=1 Tax=Stigmatella aurantiaca (strain DW4/3-1) TaxID=378806 RepID=Q09DJ4_STIAD|nr:glycoside hydrolase family 97 catalytic domain-containing protein [Stigmatella aurantiaca]ADO69318.1 Alpha-glucosidase-like protein [Stigmatella aurantiaca DW4/3-1]EAU69816.1 alpha-glucosidase [Stigmatella aurantiaca DW4/3-1]